MPYHGKDIRSSPIFRSHKEGRYVIDHTGRLHGREGDQVDLHALLTNHSPFIDIISIETKVMRASGLFPGGFALVNRAKKATHGSIIVLRYNNQIVIRRLVKKDGRWVLVADDPREAELPINEDVQIEKIGVVITSIIKFDTLP